MVTLGGTQDGRAGAVPVDRRSHFARGRVLPRRAEACRAAGHLRHQQSVLVDGRRQVLQLLGDGEARVRDSEDRAAAAEGLSGGRRSHAESLRNLAYPIDWDALLDYVGRPAILKPYSGGGWKHVYKVQRPAGAARGLRRHGAVLHDAPGVHRLRPVRALLHVRQDRHHAGRLRSARAALPGRSRVPVGRSSARASCATRRPSTRRSATR